jgi:hypothetical protein
MTSRQAGVPAAGGPNLDELQVDAEARLAQEYLNRRRRASAVPISAENGTTRSRAGARVASPQGGTSRKPPRRTTRPDDIQLNRTSSTTRAPDRVNAPTLMRSTVGSHVWKSSRETE